MWSLSWRSKWQSRCHGAVFQVLLMVRRGKKIYHELDPIPNLEPKTEAVMSARAVMCK